MEAQSVSHEETKQATPRKTAPLAIEYARRLAIVATRPISPRTMIERHMQRCYPGLTGDDRAWIEQRLLAEYAVRRHAVPAPLPCITPVNRSDDRLPYLVDPVQFDVPLETKSLCGSRYPRFVIDLEQQRSKIVEFMYNGERCSVGIERLRAELASYPPGCMSMDGAAFCIEHCIVRERSMQQEAARQAQWAEIYRQRRIKPPTTALSILSEPAKPRHVTLVRNALAVMSLQQEQGRAQEQEQEQGQGQEQEQGRLYRAQAIQRHAAKKQRQAGPATPQRTAICV